ncbi:NB-ARC domain-containing protein [Streptomyces sp. NPDC087844]|uniref:NB-ARC domain-containing protein n=1 Tax=Streptomyces sp. NPDC087844 TaxID=3365805 RepID=UPI0038305363
MEAELAALAASGATTLVGLMISDSWSSAKERLTRFLAQRRSAGEAEEELQAASEELARARLAEDTAAEEEIEADWRQRLLDVLREEPAAAAELRGLLAEWAGNVSHTVISGGVNHGPAFQGAQIHGGITFNVPAAMPTAGETARPDQVPVLTGPFSNRRRELSLLDAMCGAAARRQSGVDVTVVGGLPGVGKSAMTRKWASMSRQLFPDGQLYVDFAALRGQAATGGTVGADVSEALAMVLRSLKVSDAGMPASLAERTNLFRSRSAGQRLLLVLDDVSQPAQVRPLIPKGPGSAVLVTSHGKLGELVLDGAQLISLEPLDAEGGLALLADRCGEEAVAAERAAAERLVELCGGLPVALQIAAARLITDDGLTMTSLSEELEDEAGRLAALVLPGFQGTLPGEEYSVSALLGSSYRLLPPDAARLYRLLGWLPTGAFDAGVAAVAADLDTPSAKRLLRTLVTASFVEAGRDGRYRMHDLVRLHARERAAEEEPSAEEKAMTRRVATHYLVLAAFADRALRKERLRIADLSPLLRTADDPFAVGAGPSPLEWLDAERHAILAVLRAASRHGLYSLVWPLAEAFTALFLRHRYLEAWKESLELGVASAVALAESAETASDIAEAAQAEARLRSLLSRPLMDLGETDRAGSELRTADARGEVTGHLTLRASVQEFLGRYLDRVDPAQAAPAYRRSYELNKEAGQSRGAAIAAYFLGCALDARGEYAEALETLCMAHHDLLAREEPDLRMAARAMAAIGVVHDHLGVTEEAVRALREAVRVLEEEKATHYEAEALVTLVDIAERAGSHQDSVRGWLTRAVTLHEANGNPVAEDMRRRLENLGW